MMRFLALLLIFVVGKVYATDFDDLMAAIKSNEASQLISIIDRDRSEGSSGYGALGFKDIADPKTHKNIYVLDLIMSSATPEFLAELLQYYDMTIFYHYGSQRRSVLGGIQRSGRLALWDYFCGRIDLADIDFARANTIEEALSLNSEDNAEYLNIFRQKLEKDSLDELKEKEINFMEHKAPRLLELTQNIIREKSPESFSENFSSLSLEEQVQVLKEKVALLIEDGENFKGWVRSQLSKIND